MGLISVQRPMDVFAFMGPGASSLHIAHILLKDVMSSHRCIDGDLKNTPDSETLMRHFHGHMYHEYEHDDLCVIKKNLVKKYLDMLPKKYRVEGAYRSSEGGPERHLLRHCRDHRHRVLFTFTFLKLLCKKGIMEQNMMGTVDEYTVHQLKGFNGKMLKTTAEEGWDLDDENDEKNLFLTMLRNIRGTTTDLLKSTWQLRRVT